MEKKIVNSYEDFEKLVGQQIGVSDYVEITQDRINLFADATSDHQWIHVDVERAKAESPFKSTIVHGYLTLSMLPYLWNQIIEVNNLKMMINYGMEKMRFGQAVLSGQRIRLNASMQSLANLRGVAKAEIKFWPPRGVLLSCGDRHSASLGASVPACRVYSSARGTGGTSSSPRRRGSGPGGRGRMPAIPGTPGTSLGSPPCGGNRGESFARQCVSLGRCGT